MLKLCIYKTCAFKNVAGKLTVDRMFQVKLTMYPSILHWKLTKTNTICYCSVIAL